MTNKVLVDRIVRETSLSAGDVSNALISLSKRRVRGSSDGHERRLGRVGFVPPHRVVQDDGHAGGSHRQGCIEHAEITFTPKKAMSDAAKPSS